MKTSIPDCPVCRRASCVVPSECRRRMLAEHPVDERAVRALTDDLTDFVLSPEAWRAKYGSAA